jgi:gliding motility-associated lipoprotein GldD
MKKLVFFFVLVFAACAENNVPKPYGYFRVDLPDASYQLCDTTLPYTFAYASTARVILKNEKHEQYWFDIEYPELNAAIHCSYKPISGNLYQLSEDAHRLVYKHLIKADDISEEFFANPSKHVYGIFYNLQGNTASVAQFVLTDSTRHFVRGAVYFNHVPNKDSIAPMADFIRKDVMHLMESFTWK